MNNDRELMQQALDALITYDGTNGEGRRKRVLAALRERLAQPEQESVALEIVYETIIKWDEGGGKRSRRELARSIIALYTTPPQRKPLTDDEIDALMPVADGSAETDVVPVEVSPGLWGKEYSEVDAWSRPLVFQIARAIEAKLKEKNA